MPQSSKITATSRKGKRIREKNPDHPLTVFCREAIDRMGNDQKTAAIELNVTPALVSQYLSGETHPSVERLIELSGKSGLSMGRISTLAAAHAGKPIPKAGDLEGRVAALDPMFQDMVYEALLSAERAAAKLPRRLGGPPVDNGHIDDWQAPGETVQRGRRRL